MCLLLLCTLSSVSSAISFEVFPCSARFLGADLGNVMPLMSPGDELFAVRNDEFRGYLLGSFLSANRVRACLSERLFERIRFDFSFR